MNPTPQTVERRRFLCQALTAAAALPAQRAGGRRRGRLDEGTLKLVFESPNAAALNFPHNIAVSPRGALLLCEDAPGFEQYLRGVTLDGRIFDFALNVETSREWAGATFAGPTRGGPPADSVPAATPWAADRIA